MTSPVKTCFVTFVLFMVACAATGADVVGPQLSVTKTEYLIGEPVSLTFGWTNRSEGPVDFDTQIALEHSSLYVSVDGREFRKFTRRGGFVRLGGDRRTYVYVPVTLAPRESFSITAFVVDGDYHGLGERFLLYEPGRYILRAGLDDKPNVTIDVRPPITEADKQALVRWKEDVSKHFELPPPMVRPNLNSLKAFIDDYPNSVYAQYARLGVATHLARHERLRGTDEAITEARRHIEMLVGDGTAAPIVEHAQWLTVFLPGSREDYERVAYEIQQLNPKSMFLRRLRRSGITPRRPDLDDHRNDTAPAPDDKKSRRQEEPARPGPIPLQLDGGSLKLLPPGAAKLFEKYWKAFARRDIDGAMECLSDDFVSIDGTRDGRRRYWEATLRTIDLSHVHIRVEKAHEATSYQSPPGPVGKSTRIEGDLLVVQGRGTAREKGRTDTSAIAWVLRRVDEDTWTIVSEFAGPVGQPPQEPDVAREVIEPPAEPRPPAQQPPEKPDGAQRAREGWIVVHPAQTEFDPERFKTVAVEDRSFLHEKHRRDEILRELVEKYRSEKDIEIREGGGQLFVVYRWIKDPRIEQMRETHVRATLEQMEAKYARDRRIGPYVLKDVKTQYDVTVEEVPYALLIEFHDDQRSASAQVTIAGRRDLDATDPRPADPPDPDEWRPTRIGDSRVYWRRTADGTELLWHNTWGLKFTVSGITRADDPLLKHYLERFPPPRQDAPR